MKTLFFGLITAIGLSAPAFAQVSEIRFGAHQHDIEFFGLGGEKGKETSAALNAEIIFAEPNFLKWALSPQPYIGGSLNLEGNTSYGSAGLMWRQTLGDALYFDFASGLMVHNGTKEVPLPSYFDDPAIVAGINGGRLTAAQLQRVQTENVPYFESLNTEIEFGSSILFREALTLGLRVSDRWATEIYVEHLSHGNILVQNGLNEGLNVLGGRLSYRFD